MRRYLEFLQSFEPAIKLRWQSAQDPTFKIVDLLSRPESDETPQITNRNIPGGNEPDIELGARKLASATVSSDNYSLLMDFLLEQQIHKLKI